MYVIFVIRILGEIIIAYRNNRERAETQATQRQEEDTSHDWGQSFLHNSNESSTKKEYVGVLAQIHIN
jgi:hypothetical protein